MSRHPTERVRTVQEMQATSLQSADNALRRVANAEERLARVEARLAERDKMLADFQEAYGRQADVLSAMTAVVRELEAKVGKGVDQVLTGLEARVSEVERTSHEPQVILDEGQIRTLAAEVTHAIIKEKGLRPPQKRGPKPKNKPKDLVEGGEDAVAEEG